MAYDKYMSLEEAMKQDKWRYAPCMDYDCICADSGCKKSWDHGCIAEYMKCQATQVCGDIAKQPHEVTSYNFGMCPNWEKARAPTP
jgi:hypothetical protein